MQKATKVYLVRHGETLWNLEGRFQGRTDIALSEEGLRQAKLLSRRLQRIPISSVYASTLSRSYATAEVIASYHNLPVTKIPELMEMSYGCWEGKKLTEINEQYGEEFPRWLNNPTLFQVPEGEAIHDLQSRSIRAINKIVSDHPGEHIIVVAHGITIKTIICGALNLELANLSRFYQDNTALNIIEYAEGKGTVLLLNSTCHLVE